MNSTMLIIGILWSTIVFLSCMTSNDALGDKGLLINCGLPESTNSESPLDGRLWQSDDHSGFAPSNLNTVSTSVVSADAEDIPYKTGRVFWSDMTYTLSVTPGPVFVRLYFFPNVTSNNTLPHQFSTSLVANNFTLLHDFNPFLNSVKESQYEFQLIIPEKGENNLNLTFSPGSASPSYGYVNGIEIRSVPEGLYLKKPDSVYMYVTDNKNGYTVDQNAAAFQTAYRLNVGGENVDRVYDNPGGMERRWDTDEQYVVAPKGVKVQPVAGKAGSWTVNYTKATPPYVAPKIVYETGRRMGDYPEAINLAKNLTWSFEVDAGFDYVVRLHMREMDLTITGSSQRMMSVYIGGYVAQERLDIWYEAGGLGKPVYKDYVISMPRTSNTSKAPLSLALHPLPLKVADVFLSGLEILKLSDSSRNLAVPNPPYNGNDPTSVNQTTNTKTSSRNKILFVIGAVIGGLLLASVILLALCCRRVQYKKLFTSAKSSSKGQWLPAASVESQSSAATTKPNSSRPSLPSDLCRRFSLGEIRVATCDFDEDLVVGTGGFGKVYRGCIDDGATSVAIKRLNSTSKQGEHEFLTEIEMLSRLRHLHLVSLIGYCEDQGEMILVYEYMPRGTLRDHLNYKDANGKDQTEVLSWKQRLLICIGSARGLDYLHAGAKQLIIHRDVKSTNILLDDKWTAKVSDFGLSKVGPASDAGVAHVSTVVKGSFGYLDPEYYKRGQLTEKSDVFSFGVVLFEVLCARPAINVSLPKEQVNLANWGRACYRKGILYTIVDPNLSGQIAPECLRKFGEIADMCVRSHRDERPSMRDIVWSLEFALTLQQTAEKNASNVSPMVEVPSDGDDGGDARNPYKQTSGVGDDTDEFASNTGSAATTNSTITNYHMDIKSGSVFSEILDPRAR